ncbi:hypothetical protein PHSY_002159 [Pseudozyma hubeiensis SY62]|uniref:Uncharacterized protein n=1 Tax=Pseudozyma hubeiensis (strain SY62) TaxID=1305764 RepID=R9P0C9_PSEHS|nr:hypothetical protein PHSY_002159 [Pseudozyma hubeiensis SY62]GAC94586.1 hypothetical protein PHSY_002159 [Pseudozyma hubeiensis SY62]
MQGETKGYLAAPNMLLSSKIQIQIRPLPLCLRLSSAWPHRNASEGCREDYSNGQMSNEQVYAFCRNADDHAVKSQKRKRTAGVHKIKAHRNVSEACRQCPANSEGNFHGPRVGD